MLSEQSLMKQPAIQHQPCVGAAKDHCYSPFKQTVAGKRGVPFWRAAALYDIKFCPPIFHLIAEAVLPRPKGLQAAWLS